MSDMLARIAAHKRLEIKEAMRQAPLAKPIFPIRDFEASIKTHQPAIIAELKKASPSRGVIRSDFDVASIATIYEENGACCLSVLTDEHFFQGDPSYLNIAKAHSSLPILRKDFILDAYQIDESLSLGADCILLIVALLDDTQLHDYCEHAKALNLAVLVESHTREELERAIRLPTPLIGINNRNLQTFVTSLSVTLELSPHVPSDKIIITESGIHHTADLKLMRAHGIHAFLIGESLMRAPDIGLKLKEFIQ